MNSKWFYSLFNNLHLIILLYILLAVSEHLRLATYAHVKVVFTEDQFKLPATGVFQLLNKILTSKI